MARDQQEKPQDVEDNILPVQTNDVGVFETIGKSAVDPALAFRGLKPIEYTVEEGKRVLRKIDLYLLPALCWVYAVQFADKTSLNYASVMGIRTDTHLDPRSQQYSWVSSIFYAGYILWE